MYFYQVLPVSCKSIILIASNNHTLAPLLTMIAVDHAVIELRQEYFNTTSLLTYSAIPIRKIVHTTDVIKGCNPHYFLSWSV